VNGRQSKRIAELGLRQWAEKLALIPRAIHSGTMTKFQEQMREPHQSAAPSNGNDMFDQDGALPCHQFDEGHGQSRRRRKAFGEVIEGEFENGKLRHCDQRVVVKANPGPKTQEIAPHREVKNLTVTISKVPIGASPAASDNMQRVGPIPLTADHTMRCKVLDGHWQRMKCLILSVIKDRADRRTRQKMAKRLCVVSIHRHGHLT